MLFLIGSLKTETADWLLKQPGLLLSLIGSLKTVAVAAVAGIQGYVVIPHRFSLNQYV